MKSILITGCNRGLGLGLIKHLVKLANPPKAVIATCRSIEKAEELQKIANHHKNVHLIEFDIRNFDQYEEFAKKVGNIVQDHGLNVLYNNAGVSPKFTRIQFVKPEQLMETFKVNTVGPIMLTKTLLPLLKAAVKANPEAPAGAGKALIVNMSSYLGSLSLNTDGGLYPYRCSKTALNMATKSLSIDLEKEGIMAVSLHPGWVKTDMGGSNAPLDIDTSVSGIVQLLNDINSSHNGGFYEYNGKKMDW